MLGAAPGYNTVSRIPIHKKTRIVQRHTPVRLSKNGILVESVKLCQRLSLFPKFRRIFFLDRAAEAHAGFDLPLQRIAEDS